MRRIYQLILRLHPAPFRQRFGSEMLGVFDEAAQTEGPFFLIVDGVRSLFKQRVFKPHATIGVRQRAAEGSNQTRSLFIAHQPAPLDVQRLLLGAAISFSLFILICALIGGSSGASMKSNHVYLRGPKLSEALNPSDLMSISDECAAGAGAGCQAEPKQDLTALHSAIPNVRARRDELPFPSGHLGVGQVSYSFSASGALTRNTANSEFTLLVWYPATIDPNTSVAVDNVWQYSKSAGKFVETHTVANAGMAGGDERYPLILFAPAGGNEGVAYLSQIENLVSHGYVIVCLQGSEASNEISFEDTRMNDFEADMRRAFFFPGSKASQAIWGRAESFEQTREAAECARIRFALNEMVVLATDDSQGAPFVHRVDFGHIGALGHASGGNVVANLCASDVNISACLDEDGWTANGLGAQAQRTELRQRAFLWIDLPLKQPRQDALTYAHMNAAEFRLLATRGTAAADRQLQTWLGPAYKVSLLAPDLTDKNFTDGPLVWSMRQGRIEKSKAGTALAIINTYSRAFFDEYLKHNTASFLDSAGNSPFPGVQIQRYGIR